MGSRSQAELIKRVSEVVEQKIELIMKTFTAKFAEITDQNTKVITENEALKNLNRELIARIKSLETKLTEIQSPTKVSTESQPLPEQTVTEQTEICDIFGKAAASDKIFDVLVISDSIYRHVGAACPKKKRDPKLPSWAQPSIHTQFTMEGKTVKKVVVPGARCPRLFSEVASIAQEHSFSEVIVHVGTNYMYTGDQPDETADEIVNFLHALSNMMPSSKIPFSQVLPRILCEGPEIRETLNAIRRTNELVYDACHYHRHGFIEHVDFRPYRGRIDRNLLARDGCHLSFNGVAAIERSIREHLLIFHHPFVRY